MSQLLDRMFPGRDAVTFVGEDGHITLHGRAANAPATVGPL